MNKGMIVCRVQHLWLSLFLALTIACFDASASASPRPTIPAAFDRATVQSLLDTIQNPYNATILKMGYFGRHIVQPLPTSEGFEMVESALDKEPVDSQRWFLLQGVRAFAGFRVLGISSGKGFEAYHTLFTHAPQAFKVGTEDSVYQAINEFVTSVAGAFRDSGLQTDARTQASLVEAWVAYAELLSQSKTPQVVEPEWGLAVDKSNSRTTFLPALQKTLSDPAIPKSYALLRAAASLYSSQDPQQATQFLLQAKLLLPTQDKDEVRWFYRTLVNALDAQGRLQEEVQFQQEQVEATGWGRGKLLALYARVGDQVHFDALAKVLSAPDADEREVNDAGDRIFALAKDPQAIKVIGEQPVPILSQYLSPQRQRSLLQELHARDLLGVILIGRGKLEQAKAVLVATPPKKDGQEPALKSYYVSIEQGLAYIQQLAAQPHPAAQ